MSSELHYQFERYDSDHIIRQTSAAIRAGTFTGSLLDLDDRQYMNLRRPGVLGNRLSDGSYVTRRDPDAYLADLRDPETGETKKVSLTTERVARMMADGDLVVRNGFGHQLRDAEREMRYELRNDAELQEKLAMLPRMETSRRMPFMGIQIIAAQRGVEIDLETARDLSLKERTALLTIGHALDKGEWAPASPAMTR